MPEPDRFLREAAQRQREWDDKQRPHPLAVGPLAHIPIPERPKPKRKNT